MKKTVFIIALSFFCIEAKSQNVDLNNTTDYIRVQKNGETGYTRAFGLNGANQLYIGSIEKTIGNMYFFNKGTGHLMTLNPSGNIGIGTTNPGAKLDILSNTGQTESLMRFKISDAPSDYLQFTNATGVANRFMPLIKGNVQSSNISSLVFIASTDATNDNSGSSSMMRFDTRRSSNDQGITTRPLFQWTNFDQKLMTMSANGNLGIGTTNPQERFQIGNTYAFHDGGHKVIGFLYKPSGGVDLDPSLYSSEIRFDPTNGNFHFGTSNTVTSGPTARLSINKTGNVGIGTTNPLAKLDVRGVIKTSHTDGRYVNLFTSGDGNSYINIAGGSTTSRFGFQVDGSSKMSIMKNGNVGIGTADTKGYKLGVKGKIAAEEVKVALHANWPDYVFEDNYNLPTLQQVENHITEKGHLENIPSAAEVAENGIQLGEMNTKLLQKIEELTLYMIEQNKKTDLLQQEVEALKKKNEELEKKIK
ncbi:hypothetical protein J8L88_15765 [Aquimarina sp. MMG015]|uniref:hypothetical protein n=1 Tax=Aquimarina sp. MMG015 TaxID=2822689 RepID=UPI001B39EDC3|nr:hypothetical protein [Aquimarina sp. MMG015]MBQ4804321.1 hypothetical protein [Aquimarina sp. MMG015]